MFVFAVSPTESTELTAQTICSWSTNPCCESALLVIPRFWEGRTGVYAGRGVLVSYPVVKPPHAFAVLIDVTCVSFSFSFSLVFLLLLLPHILCLLYIIFSYFPLSPPSLSMRRKDAETVVVLSFKVCLVETLALGT